MDSACGCVGYTVPRPGYLGIGALAIKHVHQGDRILAVDEGYHRSRYGSRIADLVEACQVAIRRHPRVFTIQRCQDATQPGSLYVRRGIPTMLRTCQGHQSQLVDVNSCLQLSWICQIYDAPSVISHALSIGNSFRTQEGFRKSKGVG